MEETIVFPSPNWFHVSIMGASQDGWLVYGGPSKSLCFLEPLDSIGVIDSKQRFKAHVFHRAHKEKISSVDISPEWPEKRNVITGGFDGVVKEWSIEPKERGWIINYLHCQEEHGVQKEEVTGVCYGAQTIAVSVGSAGSICKWDLNTNVVKRYSTHLKNFKPTCISASPHKQLHVAVGTRQGVVFVIDISGAAGKLIYKVRGQDDEINRVSWCPQYAVTINKSPGKERKKKEPFTAATRMERIRNDLEPSEALEAAIAEQSLTNEQNDSKTQEVAEQSPSQGKKKEGDAKQKQTSKEKKEVEKPEEEEVIIPEDDMFDVYKDHEDNEFGHKKYEPQDVYVKVKDEVTNDFLAECEKLKSDILKNKNQPEESIESLVEALDKTHVEETTSVSDQTSTQASQDTKSQDNKRSQDAQKTTEYSHLLASIGKYGVVHIWSQTGKLVGSCAILFNVKRDQRDQKNRGPNWPTLHWFKADSLLIADGKNQLLETNPLKLADKDKLEWRVVHSLHRRGLYYVHSNAPRVQTPDMVSDDWVVWTIGQDRSLVSYNMKERKKIEMFASSGAYLYSVKPCAYDAGKIAITSGDGSIRVWETNTSNELEDQLSSGVITSYWQNVQGKILNAVWHPTKENLLAFGTAESRVGILDATGSCEKPAKNFPNAFKQGVYSLSWGEGMNLYACGNGELVMFRANKTDDKGRQIIVEVEGQVWEVTEVLWTPHGLVVGANNGGMALLSHTDHHVITATFVFLKMIYTIAWHPQQTTSSQEESKYKNYIALCSSDKEHAISILEFEDKGENAKQFNKVMEPLAGHEGAVLTVAWNPHRDAQLLSTSQDNTVRIWNVSEGECVSIFGGHTMSVNGGMWCAQPKLADKVLSSGGDSCLRLWDIRDYPVELFEGVKKEKRKKKIVNRAKDERRKNKKLMKEIADELEKVEDTAQQENIEKPEQTEDLPSASENVATTAVELKLRGSKFFLLPRTAKMITKKSMTLVRTILTKYIEEDCTDLPNVLKTTASNEKGLGFFKMFGTMNDVNELLDIEANRHLTMQEWESYLMLLFYRGRVDEMILFASEKDLLDPYLLSLSPTVSFKYWKDTIQLYLTQLERLAAKGQEDKASAYRFYGGPIYRKATAFLSVHNLKGCVETLMESDLFKEAYLICRLRHMDSVAEEVLQKWTESASKCGSLMLAAILQMLRGDISEASITLGRSTEIKYLKLAAQLAKLAGHNTFATHIEDIVKIKESQEPKEEELAPLPSRIEALLNADSDDDSDDSDEEITENETVINSNDDVNGDLLAANGLALVNVNGKGDVNVANEDANGVKETEK